MGLGTTETGRLTQYFADKKTEITDNIVPVGYAVNDMEVLLLDDTGKKVGIDRIGEIAVKSPTNMIGYYKNRELTQKTLREGWCLTGDTGYTDRDGFFYYTGRKKDMIISGMNLMTSSA